MIMGGCPVLGEIQGQEPRVWDHVRRRGVIRRIASFCFLAVLCICMDHDFLAHASRVLFWNPRII